MFIFFLLFQIVALSPGFLPVTVGSLNILLYFILGILHLFFNFSTKLNWLSILITRALNSQLDRLVISSSLSSISEALLCSFIWAMFLCLGTLVWLFWLIFFFFNSLVVGVPCSLIFWCFWLFIDFTLVVILLLVVQGSKGFLPTPPSWPGFLFISFERICSRLAIYVLSN